MPDDDAFVVVDGPPSSALVATAAWRPSCSPACPAVMRRLRMRHLRSSPMPDDDGALVVIVDGPPSFALVATAAWGGSCSPACTTFIARRWRTCPAAPRRCLDNDAIVIDFVTDGWSLRPGCAVTDDGVAIAFHFLFNRGWSRTQIMSGT